MTTATTLAPTREQLIEAIAALRAARDTFHVLLEPDSAAGEFFGEIAHRLQDEFFGEEHVECSEGDEWMCDPVEVELHARETEIEADALEYVQQYQALGDRIRTLRAMAPRYRELETIDLQFSTIMRCDCGSIETESAKGWHAVRRTNERGMDETIPLCPKCATEADDAR